MLILKATQKVPLAVSFQDAEGNPASVEGIPVWGVSDPSVGVLNVAPDGLSAELLAGSPTTGQVNVTADADLGSGVTPVLGVLDVQIVAGDAAVATLSAGTPVDQ